MMVTNVSDAFLYVGVYILSQDHGVLSKSVYQSRPRTVARATHTPCHPAPTYHGRDGRGASS